MPFTGAVNTPTKQDAAIQRLRCNGWLGGVLLGVSIRCTTGSFADSCRDCLSATRPATVRLDPFRTPGPGHRERQLEDRDSLARVTSCAHRDNLVRLGQINALDGDVHAEDLGLEG